MRNLILLFFLFVGALFAQLPQDKQPKGDIESWLTPDERIVALTLLGEARGEFKRGMFAVGCVIRQRMIERKLSARQVCLQDKQFSYWNGKFIKKAETVQKPYSNFDILLFKGVQREDLLYVGRLAIHLCSGRDFERKYVGFANHYCALKANPYWTYKILERDGQEDIKVPIKPVKIIGDHKFYKL